jgi:hypothetical protein
MLSYFQQLFASAPPVGKTRVWTEEILKALLRDYHIYYQARDAHEHEQHYMKLYGFALRGQTREEGILIAIDRYYADNIKGQPPSTRSKKGAWHREETLTLFSSVYYSRSDGSILDRTDQERFIYYYDVLGMVFIDWGTTIEEGISTMVEAYYKEHTQVKELERRIA